MADGVPGHEDPDLLQQVDSYIKRRAPPLRFNNFQRCIVVYKTAGAARGPLAMVIISLYYKSTQRKVVLSSNCLQFKDTVP